MSSLLHKTSNGAAIAVGSIIVLMMLHVTAEVLLRVLFELHIPGTMEVVTYYYMVSAVFVGIFCCTVEDCHVRVDVFAQLFRGRVRRLIDWVGAIAVVVYFGLFSYGLVLKAVASWKRQETVDAIAFQLTTWPSRWVAFAGIALSLIAALYGVFRLVASKRVQQEVSCESC